MAEVSLGDRVKDIISGQEGIVTGISDYLAGCRRVQVVPEEIKDGLPIQGFWIDEAMLEVVQKEAVVPGKPKKEEEESTGGPRDDAERGADAER